MKYDLLIQHGEVLDPAAGLKGPLDVAISGGKIAAVAPSLPANEARHTISARGLYVSPAFARVFGREPPAGLPMAHQASPPWL